MCFCLKKLFFDYRIISFCIVSSTNQFRIDILFVSIDQCFSYKSKYYPWSFILFLRFKTLSMMKKFSDVKFSAFDAIEKLINFLFKATFAIMQKKWCERFLLQHKLQFICICVYMYVCFWILYCETIVNLLNILLTRRGTHKVYILHMSDILSFAPTYVY